MHNGQAEEFFKKAVVQAKTVIEEGSATPDEYLFYGLAAAEIKEEVDKASVDIYNIMKKDRYNNYYYSLANAHLIERKKTPDSAIRFYDDAIKQYKKADEMMLLYLCYYYMERIYNTRKLELLIKDTSE